MRVLPVHQHCDDSLPLVTTDALSGQVCESADFFGKNRQLPSPDQAICLRYYGWCYGFSMTSLSLQFTAKYREVLTHKKEIFGSSDTGDLCRSGEVRTCNYCERCSICWANSCFPNPLNNKNSAHPGWFTRRCTHRTMARACICRRGIVSELKIKFQIQNIARENG